MGLTGMKISHRKRRGKGGIERLNVSAELWCRFSCLQALPVNIDADVRTTLLRTSYKAGGVRVILFKL